MTKNATIKWDSFKLCDAPLSIIDGDRGKNYPREGEMTSSGFCLFLNTKNVRKSGFIFDDCLFISKEKDELLRKGKLQRDDLVLTTRGTVGNVAFFNEKVPFDNIRINSGMVIIRPNQDLLDPKFNYYLFKYLNTDFEMFVSGSAQPQLPIRDLKEIEIMLPSLLEQKAIASVLSSLDDKIDLLYRQNKTLESLAETIFRQHFIVEVDEKWEEAPLDSIAHFLNGLACQKYPPGNPLESLPVIKIKELRQGFSDNSDQSTSKVNSVYIVKNGDVLFSWSGSLEVVLWSHGEGVLNQHLFKVTSDKYPKWFYYLWLKMHLPDFRDIATDKATTMGHIQRKHLNEARVVLPDDRSFETLNIIFEPLIEQCIKNNSQIRTLATLRETLLPKLMSGEVWVQYDKDEVEKVI